MKSVFPREMLSGSELNIDVIAGKLLTFTEQLHLAHWQTKSYAEHVATGELYEYLQTFRDDLIEKLMGYTGRRPGEYKMDNIKVSSLFTVSELISFASSLKRYGESNMYHDVCNLADELSGTAAKYKYLLSLS